MNNKKKIYYARTYRHLKISKGKSILYLFMLVIPSFIILFLNILNISRLMSYLGVRVLGRYFPGLSMQIIQNKISILGTIEYIDLPTVYPDMPFVFLNLMVVMGLLLLTSTRKKKGNLVSIFLTMGLVIHLINCIYFIFATNYFPYSAFQYSDLYMKQQIGIWMMFIILSGVVTAFLGGKGLHYKILAFVGIMGYSLIFGIVRYILFLYIIQRFSILYMALMFFVFGPFFDFLYLVGVYSIFLNKMIQLYDSEEGRDEWVWS